MKIKNIHVKKFRGFDDVSIELGENITVISGKNGTQKTTLLGMLSQPFSLTPKNCPEMYAEKPLCGGNYTSSFAEKFKVSDKFDQPKEHEWTLNFNGSQRPVTVESMPRPGKDPHIRFWNKNKKKGSGYIPFPVIYLSLKRLLPIGEDTDLNQSSSLSLSDDEKQFYIQWHNKILIDTTGRVTNASHIESKHKKSLAAESDNYDWKLNSAGQDNIGKIILSILSFKRLKDKYPSHYQGGILAIDEIDATLYPGSQLKLLEAFRTFSSKFKIQIIFTTHSLTLMEQSCHLQNDDKIPGQVKVVFLEKRDGKIICINGVSYGSIENRLRVTIEKKKRQKIPVFTEDAETVVFAKCLLKNSRMEKLDFINERFSCSMLAELRTKLELFKLPESIIVLDGDYSADKANRKKLGNADNIVLLPGDISPERILAKFLHELSDSSEIWEAIDSNYCKDVCFRDVAYEEIIGGGDQGRTKAKQWFNDQIKHWGRHGFKVINPWTTHNKVIVDNFLNKIDLLINEISKQK